MGLGSGMGTYVAVKELGFPLNDEYEALHDKAKSANSKISKLNDTQDSLHKLGIEDSDATIAHKIDYYRTVATEAEAHYPHNYNPHIEGVVSGGSAIAVAGIVMYGLYTRVSRRAKRANLKIDSADKSAQVEN